MSICFALHNDYNVCSKLYICHAPCCRYSGEIEWRTWTLMKCLDSTSENVKNRIDQYFNFKSCRGEFLPWSYCFTRGFLNTHLHARCFQKGTLISKNCAKVIIGYTLYIYPFFGKCVIVPINHCFLCAAVLLVGDQPM